MTKRLFYQYTEENQLKYIEKYQYSKVYEKKFWAMFENDRNYSITNLESALSNCNESIATMGTNCKIDKFIILFNLKSPDSFSSLQELIDKGDDNTTKQLNLPSYLLNRIIEIENKNLPKIIKTYGFLNYRKNMKF